MYTRQNTTLLEITCNGSNAVGMDTLYFITVGFVLMLLFDIVYNVYTVL